MFALHPEAVHVLESLPGHAALLDKSGTILAVNSLWERGRLRGLGAGLGPGANFLQTCDAQGKHGTSEGHSIAEAVRDVIERRKHHAQLTCPAHTAAERRWFLVRIRSWQGGEASESALGLPRTQNSVIAALLTYDDVTPWVEAEKRAQRESEHVRLLLDHLPLIGVAELNSSGHVLAWSRGASELTGYADIDILGRRHTIFCTPEDIAADAPAQMLAVALRDGIVSRPLWRVRKDGSRFRAEVSLRRLHLASRPQPGFIEVMRFLEEDPDARLPGEPRIGIGAMEAFLRRPDRRQSGSPAA